MEGLKGLKVGFLGCGAMGASIARALIERAGVAPQSVVLYDRLAEAREGLAAALGARAAGSETEVAREADVIVLATKPHDVTVALGLIEWPSEARTLVSIAAGVDTEQLRERVPSGVRVARAMPNVAALVGAGITGVLRHHDPEVMAQVEAVFASCGEVVTIEKERDFGAVTALSGSGPAYVFVAIEALADGGVLMGLSRPLAQKLALHTVLGAATLALHEGVHPADLKDRVASPGGTTIHGLAALERAGFRGALIDAVEAATQRSEALGAQGRDRRK